MTAADCLAAPPRPAAVPIPGAAAVLAALPAGVAFADGAGRLTALNEPARAVLAAADRDLAIPLPGDGGTRLRLASGAALRIESRCLGADAGAVLLFTDVTREQRLDDVVARHQRLAALGELAATLAHQIRTPLAAALLYVGNAALPGLDPGQRTALLDRAGACLRDLEQLVDGMLGFARGAAAGPRATPVADVLAAVDVAARPACRPGQVVRIDRAPEGLHVAVGREALAGAVLNLVQNALQAAGPAAEVRVTVDAPDGHVQLAVSDNGPGIPAALRARVLEPFFTTRADGTGLGLAVVDALVRGAGGSLAITDNAPRGARVCLRLPQVVAPAGAEDPTTP